MVTIPRGSFVKKVSTTTPGTVTFAISRSFFMDETETTQQAWKSLSGGLNPSCIQNPPNGTNPSWACTTTNNFDAGPVERVDWYAAMAFANARSASEGLQECYSLTGCPTSTTDPDGWRDGAYACSGVEGLSAALSCTGYRLPTEMEWEYAARAGNAAAPSGATITYNNSYPNPTSTSYWTATTSPGRTQAVKTKPATASSTSAAVAGTPNKWGLYDMAGNVLEMVEDWEPAAFPHWSQTDQTDFRGNTVANNETILRGGGNTTAWNAADSNCYNWASGSQNCHAFNNALRNGGNRNQRTHSIGFRLVRSVVQAPAGGDCGAGFHLDSASNTCEADSKACISAGTSGFSAWDGDSWGTCQKCQAGFVAEPDISTTTSAVTGVASSTPSACIPVADQPTTGAGTLCSANGVVTNGIAVPLPGDVSGRLDFTTTTAALTGNSTDSSYGFRDNSTPVATRSDKFSVTLTAGQTLFAKVSSTGLRGAANRFDPVLYLYGDDSAAAGSQCNRLATASDNASAFDVTGADGNGGAATSESEAVIRFRAPASGTYYLIVTSTAPVDATSLPYNLVVNTGKELGEACGTDSECASKSCSLGDVSNNSGIGAIGPLPGTGVWPALPTALRVCTPTPDSAWPTVLPNTRSDMVLIPAGTFIMGSPGTEKWRTVTASGIYGEEAQHRVTISRPFYLQRLEMTQGAWARVTGSTRNSNNLGAYPLIETDYYSAIKFANELSRREGLTACYNVTCQSSYGNSWIDGAIGPTECSAVSLRSASCTGYRLPTESEWEYAARAGTKGAVYYDPNGDGQAENIALNSVASWGIGDGWGQSQPGGRMAPNAWGLYDMIGNNWEMVHDSYASYPTASNSTDPGLSSPASRAVILRGGNYYDGNFWNRAAVRYNWSGNGSLGDARSNYNSVNVGFRLARTAITPIAAGTPCATGYHAAGSICDVDQIACYVENATAARQTWNGTAFGDCTATACAQGFHVEGGACLSDTKTCSTGSGTGLQKWVSGTTYGSCLAPLGGLCTANGDCDGNAQNLAHCPAATTGLPNRRCAPTGMIYLPPVTYTAGSSTQEDYREAGENLFQATLSHGLFIGTTAVTQAQWKALSNNINPSCFQSTTGTACTTTSANDSGPVERVDWYSAAAFANARSIAEGLTPCYARRQNTTGAADDPDWRDGDSLQNTSLATIACDGYRLPTDAEWEYAARAGTRGPTYNVPNGASSASAAAMNAIAWWSGNTAGVPNQNRTHAVGLKSANAFGLYDMLGNTWAWSHDTASVNPTTAQTDPIEHTVWGGNRHIRGGGFTRGNTDGLRASYLLGMDAGWSGNTAGLRLVRTPVLTALRGLCPSGYHVSGTLCEPDQVACATTATNAVGTAKSWDAVANAYGACLPYTCAVGFHLEGGACISNSKTCTVSGQTGVQDWSSGTSYSSCKLPLGALCTANADCASTTLAPTYCATGPAGTANDRCAPAGMNYIPSGTFTMGSPAGETGRAADEVQHQVTLSRPFFMGAKEVTQAEWTRLSGDFNPSCFQTTTGTACAAGNLNPTGPVERLDWFAAVGYANARSESEGLTPCYVLGQSQGNYWLRGDHSFTVVTPPGSFLPTLNCTGYRLPTEAEWEYAARAGTTGVIYNAANPLAATQTELNLIAWTFNNAGSRTQIGGQKLANAFGLFDMLGNVWEYQWDVYAAYPTAAVTDPIGAVNGTRGLRGVGYTEPLASSRSARRNDWDPAAGNNGHAGGDGKPNIGFRLARTAVLPVAQSACPTGYHVNAANNVCDPNTIACSLDFASSATQTWNGSAYGACTLVACDAQSLLRGGVCTGACSPIGVAATMTAAQAVTGALATTDSANSVRGSGYYFDKYAITLTAGQRVRVRQTATGFSDTYLYITGGSTCGILASDDDSGGSENSRINFTAPTAGTYYLHATSYGVGAVGGYTLTTSAW
jgi:formylglycine-generating enzyme required for sulfatase activity